MMRRSTKTGFFRSSFLSGLPDFTSLVVYVRLAASQFEGNFFRGQLREGLTDRIYICKEYGVSMML